MTHAARTLLDSALQLSDEERAELASELLASLDGAPDGDGNRPGSRRSTGGSRRPTSGENEATTGGALVNAS